MTLNYGILEVGDLVLETWTLLFSVNWVLDTVTDIAYRWPLHTMFRYQQKKRAGDQQVFISTVKVALAVRDGKGPNLTSCHCFILFQETQDLGYFAWNFETYGRLSHSKEGVLFFFPWTCFWLSDSFVVIKEGWNDIKSLLWPCQKKICGSTTFCSFSKEPP